MMDKLIKVWGSRAEEIFRWAMQAITKTGG